MIQDIVQDIRVRKIFESLFALENIRGIFRGILLTGLNETENLIFKVEYALPEV